MVARFLLWLSPALVLAASCLVQVGALQAHPGIDDRLELMNRQIDDLPGSAALRLKRGELYRRHGQLDEAAADFRMARTLDPEHPGLDYHQGRLWLEQGDPARARRALDRYIESRPLDFDAFLVRSEAAAALGDNEAAVADISWAIAIMAEPRPSHFFQRARLQMAMGPGGLEAAAAGLDEAIGRLGPLVSLIELAVEVDRARGDAVAAVGRLEHLPASIGQQPRWLALKGDLLIEAGHNNAAGTAYGQALEAIAALPAPRRSTRAMIALESQIRQKL